MKSVYSLVIIVLLGITQTLQNQTIQNFNIEIRNVNQNQWKSIGNLQIDSQISYKQAYVNLKGVEQIVNWSELQQQQQQNSSPFALLKFTDEQDSQNQFLSHIDLTQNEKVLEEVKVQGRKKQRNPLQLQEVLELVTNIDDQVVGINYTVKKTYQLQDEFVKASFVESQEATEVHFIPGQGAKGRGGATGGSVSKEGQSQGGQGKIGGGEEEAQQPAGILGFVKNYFWYIVIGLFVFMMLSNVDPEKVNEQAQQAAQGAQGQAQGRQARRR